MLYRLVSYIILYDPTRKEESYSKRGGLRTRLLCTSYRKNFVAVAIAMNEKVIAYHVCVSSNRNNERCNSSYMTRERIL